MQQSRDIFFDSNTLIGIYAVTYGVNYTENTQGLPLLALRARVGTTQGDRWRASRLSQMQEPLLEQVPQTEEEERISCDTMLWRPEPESNRMGSPCEECSVPHGTPVSSAIKRRQM